MAVFFSLSVFFSSYLLFLVQPMLAKMLLPQVGGAASVWIVSMLFFQVLLLGGYAYAAISSRFLSPLVQSILQCFLYTTVLLVYLPITPIDLPSKLAAEHPEKWVFYMLFFTAGLPYLLLTANSSIFQRWYYAVYEKEPYHLFSASNVGSFLGLFSYPFLWEWVYGLTEQLAYWGIGFAFMALIFSFYPVLMSRLQRWRPEVKNHRQQIGHLKLGHIAHIILLGFIPSSLFLSVTLYVTTDIASFPLIWIIPLALYLLSFVIVFASWGERWIAIAQKLHPLVIPLVLFMYFGNEHALVLFLHFLLFFVVAISVHGQLARIRPAPENLTIYYFWMSVGGVLGGLFNTAAPYLFNNIYEYPLVLVLSLLMLPSKRTLRQGLERLKKQDKRLGAAFAGVVIAMVVLWLMPSEAPSKAELEKQNYRLLHQSRNFFGVVKVMERGDEVEFSHGTTLHGRQSKNPATRLVPTSYYIPLYELISQYPDSLYQRPFGIIGLGAGTLSCLGHEGQQIDFFEIDEDVVHIAENSDYFSFVKDCGAQPNMIVGDGRVKLQEEADAKYSLFVVDAFSSDAVPLHLLTKEALQLYQSKIIQPHGVLAFNISNRYLRLAPILARLAKEIGYEAWYMHFEEEGHALEAVASESEWMIMVKPQSGWQILLAKQGFEKLQPVESTPLWTDNYTNLLPIIRWWFVNTERNHDN